MCPFLEGMYILTITIKTYFEIIFNHSLMMKLKAYLLSGCCLEGQEGKVCREWVPGGKLINQSILSSRRNQLNEKWWSLIDQTNWSGQKWRNPFSRNLSNWNCNDWISFIWYFTQKSKQSLDKINKSIDWLIDWFFEEEILSNGFEKLSLPGPGII